MPISFPHLFFKYTSICVIFLFCITGTYAKGYAQTSVTTLEGEQLDDVPWEDARAFIVVTRSILNRLRKTDEGVSSDLQTLSDAAFDAFEKKDNYCAYLCALWQWHKTRAMAKVQNWPQVMIWY